MLHCSFGQLNVFDTTTKHKTFIFCGQYSLLFVFSQFSLVEIEVSVHPSVVFDIQALFTVLDRGSIESLNRWNHSKSFQKCLLVHTVSKTDNVFTMEINLNKMFYCVVRAQAFSGELLVFDGPGHLYHKVQPKGTLFTTTSFQSLMVITCTSCLSNITMRLDYCSKPVTPYPIEIGNASFLQLPGVKYCGKNQCLLKLITEPNAKCVCCANTIWRGRHRDLSVGRSSFILYQQRSVQRKCFSLTVLVLIREEFSVVLISHCFMCYTGTKSTARLI